MTNRGIDIKHPQQRGEWAELCFMTRAAEHGLSIGIMTSPADCLLEDAESFARVRLPTKDLYVEHSFPPPTHFDAARAQSMRPKNQGEPKLSLHRCERGDTLT
jgi:hypothetical protein